MPFGLPQISFIGYPLSMPCASHAGLGFRRAGPGDSALLVEHFLALDPTDRRMRFCATLTDAAIERHVEGLWRRPSVVLTAQDGPLWAGPLHAAAPIRAAAELVIDGREAELGLSVDAGLRRRGVGTYLVQTAAHLLRPRGVRRIRAYTLPGNQSFITLARGCHASIDPGPDEVEVTFGVPALQEAYLRRRAAGMLRPAG